MTIPRCYFDKDSQALSTEIHEFSDASKLAYAAVVYIYVLLMFLTTHMYR